MQYFVYLTLAQLLPVSSISQSASQPVSHRAIHSHSYSHSLTYSFHSVPIAASD